MLKEFFAFSRRERTGIACLLSLIVLLWCVPIAWSYFRSDIVFTDTTGFHAAALQLHEMMKDTATETSRYKHRKQFVAFKRDSFPRFQKKVLVVDINRADSLLWEQLPGIGPVLARRILYFRERLGGFHSIAQVGETYGLADSVFNKIQPLLRLGDVSLRKIDLNETDEKSLADHPYINTKLARVIIRYRNSHGPFSQVEGLKGIALVDDSIYRKLEKYLVVN
ncbi:helix-hairpin-helix domain-containing protein [Chitinophaga niabensis]|uniref:ComEA family DNA-binding protein n=1 Tax=Chitinophaga niabensis TaxID=536979 RepID=UPI0031BA0CE5